MVNVRTSEDGQITEVVGLLSDSLYIFLCVECTSNVVKLGSMLDY